jgi:hypothetical protein
MAASQVVSIAALNAVVSLLYNTQIDELSLFSWQNGTRMAYAAAAGGIAASVQNALDGCNCSNKSNLSVVRVSLVPAVGGISYGLFNEFLPEGKGEFLRSLGEGFFITSVAEVSYVGMLELGNYLSGPSSLKSTGRGTFQSASGYELVFE